jgi:PAS domain S-box-containing protein
MSPHNRFSTLARAVAQGAPPADLLLELHRRIVAALRGSASVILQPAGPSGQYSAASGLGVDLSDGVWLARDEAARLETTIGSTPRVCSARELELIARRMGAGSALVVVLKGSGPAAFLIVAAPGVTTAEAIEVGDAARVEFALALELARLGREAALHRRIQELLLGFSRGISSTLSVAGALGSLSMEANALFGTRRLSVWFHERRVREIVLAASSDPAVLVGARVATDSDSIPARGLRLERPQLTGEPEDRVLIAPLRGWRRALGTLVIEGDPLGLDDQQFIDGANELGRQLSIAVETVQLLEEFLQQRRLLEDTFNSLTDLVVVADTALHVVQMNGVFAARVGKTPDEVLTQPLTDFIGQDMASWLDSGDTTPRAREAGVAFGRTKQFTDERLGGIFAVTVTPLINQDGVPVGRVLVARDITAQTALEQEREALSRRLAQSERLASLGQFVAGIAHEMNNPLQGVLGHLELLIHTSDAARPVRPTLRRIYHEGNRAAKIVRNLLVFTGSRRMNRVRLRVDRVLSRVLATRASALKQSRIEVTREQSDNVPSIEGDALLLQQALLNILVNAEHAAMLTGGPARIDTAITTSADGLRVLVSIADSGPGLPPEVLPHIFDPFFTTKEVGQGTGLGLAITYGIVQEHGGTIHAGNRPGGGAIFIVELPAALSPDGDPEPAKRKPAPKIRKRKASIGTPKNER